MERYTSVTKDLELYTESIFAEDQAPQIGDELNTGTAQFTTGSGDDAEKVDGVPCPICTILNNAEGNNDQIICQNCGTIYDKGGDVKNIVGQESLA